MKADRSHQIQRPVKERRIAIRWIAEVDAPRCRRVAAILQSILDNKSTPEDGSKP